MTIYVCISTYDYEGELFEAAYSTLAKARKHQFGGGDGFEIRRVHLDKNDLGRLIPPRPAKIKKPRK